MGAERDEREFRLEGFGLIGVGSLLLAALVGSFFLGRWYERAAPSGGEPLALGADPLVNVEGGGETDATEGLNYFDTVSGGEKALEPSREAVQPAPALAGRQQPAKRDSGAPAEPDELFYVQVFAGRDRRSAEGVVGTLSAGGYEERVRIDSIREGAGHLFKVRVAGFATREEAQAGAERLRQEGYPGAWVPQTAN